MKTQSAAKARFCLTEEERELLARYNSLSAPQRKKAIEQLSLFGSDHSEEESAPEVPAPKEAT